MAIRLKDEAALKATSATKLAAARTINGTSFDGSANITTANWGTARTITIGNSGKSVNGGGNVSWTLSEIGAAAASHGMHPASKSITTGFDTTFRTSTKGDANSGAYISTVRTDTASVTYAPQYSSGLAWGQGDTHGYLNVNYNSGVAYLGGGSSNKLNWVKQIAFTDSSITGNAKTATTLQTARTINGTSFNGSANITTANWGTARTITIGNSGKSVNGAGNVSWTLAEIGAAAASHTHNYAGSSSAGGSANSAVQLATARTINGTSFNGTANITTANWGTARTLTVGKTGKSVNGAGNVSWSLSEIGALPLTGGTLTGPLTVNAVVNLESGAVTAVDSHISFGGNSRIHENVFAINDVTSGLTHLYLGPRDTGEMRVVAFGDADKMQYRPMRAAQYNCDSGTGIRGQMWCGTGGFVVQGEEGANLHLGANNSSTDMNFSASDITVNKKMILKAALDMSNCAIEKANSISFADPGNNEGIEWLGGNGWRIYESPDALTNAAGNLQFVTNSTRRATFSTSGNLNLAGNNVTFTTSNAVVTASAGYLVLKSNAGDIVYVQGGSLRVTAPGAPATYKPVLASAFTVSSLSKYKDDITPIEEDKSIDTMEILKNTNVYTYKLKDDLENGIDKKKIGLIVEQASLDLANDEEEGIELYQMASTLWDVCKKQQEAIEKLQQEINELKAS